MAYRSIIAEGTFWIDMCDCQLGKIDSHDVVGCVNQLVLADEFDNRVFDPTGPEPISFRHVARVLAKVLGGPVDYISVPREIINQFNRDMGVSDWI